MTFLSYPVLSCKKPSRLAQLGLALGLLVAFSVQADSAKTRFADNGHYYQRINNATITWTKAKLACQAQGAYLATITSQAEQTFVYGLVGGSPVAGYFALGANDAAIEGNWQWITGEFNTDWAYSNWYINQPAGNFLYIDSGRGGWFAIGDGGWESQGYICEWSTDNYISSAPVPDLNSNNYPEDALLYVSFLTGYQTVVIKDRKPPHTTIGTNLTFVQSDIPPLGLAVLADTNGNGKLEIGVLDVDQSINMPIVRIKDIGVNSRTVRTLRFFQDGKYSPKSLSVQNDSNGNGSYELTVMALRKDSGKVYTETRDSKTGALLYSNAF